MIWPAQTTEHFVVMGRGEAEEVCRELFDPQIGTRVRYADPAAWASATAIARAFATARESVDAAGDAIGVLVNTDRGPAQTMAHLAKEAREGFSSPLRYPASNPGSLAGVPCIAFGLRGPTLVLTMPAIQGTPVGLIIAGQWLSRGIVPLVALTVHASRPPNRNLARCLILAYRAEGVSPPGDDASLAADLAWLSTVDDVLNVRE